MAGDNDNIESTSGNDQKEFTFSDYFKVIFKFRKVLLWATIVVGLIVGIIMFFIVDPVFLSSATVKSAGSGSGLSSLIGVSGIPDLGGLESISGSASKELALYEEILLSRRCIEETIIKFNLLEVYDFKYMDDAIKAFRLEIMLISPNKKANTITIGVYDKDKQRAKEIADFLIYQLNKIYSEMNALNAKNNKDFIEQRFDSVKVELELVEDSMQVFQDKYGINPEIQVEIASKTSLELEATIKSEEVKLELLSKILTADQPEVKEQKDKIEILKKQYNELNNSIDGNSLLQLKGLPSKVMNFYRLKRELEIQNRILTTIIPIYEQAKFEVKRETPTVIVLDYPNLPDKKAKPKRLTLTAISMVLFFTFFSAVIVFHQIYYKRILNFFRNE